MVCYVLLSCVTFKVQEVDLSSTLVLMSMGRVGRVGYARSYSSSLLQLREGLCNERLNGYA